MQVLKHSGAPFEVGFKWKQNDVSPITLIQKLMQATMQGLLSSGFAHGLAQQLELLFAEAEGGAARELGKAVEDGAVAMSICSSVFQRHWDEKRAAALATRPGEGLSLSCILDLNEKLFGVAEPTSLTTSQVTRDLVNIPLLAEFLTRGLRE